MNSTVLNAGNVEADAKDSGDKEADCCRTRPQPHHK